MSKSSCITRIPLFRFVDIALLEAWITGKPVLVNGVYDVLYDQCLRSNGGLWYEISTNGWQSLIETVGSKENAGRKLMLSNHLLFGRVWERSYLHALPGRQEGG